MQKEKDSPLLKEAKEQIFCLQQQLQVFKFAWGANRLGIPTPVHASAVGVSNDSESQAMLTHVLEKMIGQAFLSVSLHVHLKS